MSFLEIYLVTFVTVGAFMALVWVISVPLRDVSIVDLVWGLTFVIAAFTHYFLATGGWDVRKLLITAMYTIAGVRLSGYLTWRKIRQHPGEDFRYQRMRAGVGPAYWRVSLFSVFLLQGAIAAFISVVSLAAQYSGPQSLTVFDVLGAGVWLVGFYFEAVGDYQLARFKSDPANKGKVMDRGLWGLTRHPNYFGNAAQWWGYWLVAVSVPFGFLTIYGPVFMTFLLLRVSGVAMLEKDIANRRPEYAAYIRSVPAFFPRLRRR